MTSLHPSVPAPPAKPLRLAILEAGALFTTVADKYGTYLTLYRNMFVNSLPKGTDLSPYLDCSGYNVHTEELYPDLDSIDAILISGSHANAFDNTVWIERLVEFTKEALAKKKKVVGVCFGHQIVSRALGGKVQRNEQGWEVAVTEVDLTEEGKRVFGVDKMLMHQMHRDMVPELPPPLDGQEVQLLASTNRCKIQGMYVPGRFITVQGHPEFTAEIVSEMVEGRHELGVFDDAMYKDFMSRMGRDDGMAIALIFLKFLLGDLKTE
ncbi:putative class I glutamine amidotransferase [Ascobolus immersus RN42]|uniref:Putative class I glutamine amidotransferase n=1 Tax=Ascobolus immersus RN42 TaxID=1160509 RepID=A0A3N4IR78_ASCIM|nr:putative class I glutamine amidotransferase [Ascobolus immersus RN42]